MIYTTLNKILAYSPCGQRVSRPLTGWLKLLSYLGKTGPDDDPLALSVVLESNGLADALWVCRTVPEHADAVRGLARRYALDVIHLWDAPDIVRRFLETGDESLAAEAAGAAARAARAAEAAEAAWAAEAAKQRVRFMTILEENGT